MAYTTINKSSEHFNTNLHSGTGSSQNITTGLNMSANGGLVWNKVRSTSNNHILCDTIRGATKLIHSDLTAAESTDATSLTSFNTDGWTGGGGGNTNGSGQTFVSWNWLAGSSPSGSANTAGSINSTVSANTTSGFSIVTVSKPNTSVATIGHGLGVTPKFIIGKDLDGVDNWTCYNEALGNGKGIYLNATNAEATASTFWNSTSPTSSVFTIGSDNTWNSPSMVFYCFADVQGYSKFGSYTGNGSADGTFVYTGFKPAFVMVKRITDTQSWVLWDNKRDGINQTDKSLTPNESGAEETRSVDIVSNGFKLRDTNTATNATGSTYIYMAFAEAPLVGTNGVTAKAR